MMMTWLMALMLAAVVGLAAWEVYADLVDARRTIDRMQARIDQQDHVITELRLRIEALNKGGDS